MKKVKYLIVSVVAVGGMILGTLSKPNVARANEDREICRRSTGECVTATIVHSCTQCGKIEVD